MNDLLIFTHILKTGGTSFKRSVIDFNIPENRVYKYRGLKHFIFDDLSEARFVDGHCPYGIHIFTSRKCTYATILREPLSLAISYYYFIKQCDYPNYKHPKLEEVKQCSLVVFFKNNPNPQTWCIAGFPWNKIYSGTSQNLLSCAVKHLKERYKFVGILESIEAFENEVASFYGWSWKPIYEQSKRTFNRPKVRDLNESDKTLLQKSLSLDIQLYNEAIRLIESGSQGRYTPPNSHTT